VSAPRSAVLLSASLALASGPAAAVEFSDVGPSPHSIHGGLDADVCQFPSAVAMLDAETDSLFCTGTLIHPQVVLFAAHCMDPNLA